MIDPTEQVFRSDHAIAGERGETVSFDGGRLWSQLRKRESSERSVDPSDLCASSSDARRPDCIASPQLRHTDQHPGRRPLRPPTCEVHRPGAEGIACWFIDTDYNEESFFVRHAYFLGQNDPYSALKITLKAEINEEARATLNSDTSRPFPKPRSGRIAVKVINHPGDEVMKVFRI